MSIYKITALLIIRILFAPIAILSLGVAIPAFGNRAGLGRASSSSEIGGIIGARLMISYFYRFWDDKELIFNRNVVAVTKDIVARIESGEIKVKDGVNRFALAERIKELMIEAEKKVEALTANLANESVNDLEEIK